MYIIHSYDKICILYIFYSKSKIDMYIIVIHNMIYIYIMWYSALCTWFIDYSVVVSIPQATSTT